MQCSLRGGYFKMSSAVCTNDSGNDFLYCLISLLYYLPPSWDTQSRKYPAITYGSLLVGATLSHNILREYL